MEHKIVNFNPELCSNISNKLHKQLLKVALKSLENQFDIPTDTLEKFKSDNNITDEQFCDIIEMYINIVNVFIRCNKKEEFEEVLIAHGYPNSFIENISLKFENRDSILSFTKNTELAIKKLDYKIDISLQSRILNKVILPSVIFSLKYADNKDVTFSVDSSTFHKLRYNIALMLKEINNLKATSIMKKQ